MSASPVDLDACNAIASRADMAKFIEALRQDLTDDPTSWENRTLPDFLEAMAAYVADLDGFYRNNLPGADAEQATWRAFAHILAGASVYE